MYSMSKSIFNSLIRFSLASPRRDYHSIVAVASSLVRLPAMAGGDDRRQGPPNRLLEDAIAIGGGILIVMSFS
jgi:hypothetical protein